jgi:lactoylglutathione lyase
MYAALTKVTIDPEQAPAAASALTHEILPRTGEPLPSTYALGRRLEASSVFRVGLPRKETHLPVHELRLVVTVEGYDDAVRFYRDVLGLSEREELISPGGGRVTILDAGRATLELADPVQAEHIDEVEVGRRVAGHIRVAFQVDDTAALTDELAAAGARVIARPRRTPWNSLNARLEAPAGLQLTLFSELDE